MVDLNDRATDDQIDVDLMIRLKGGDDLALNQLMDRWSARLITFLQRMTSDYAVAVDLAQETFVRLYQSRSRYQPKGKFSTYIFTICANLARNHARWRSRHPTVSLEEPTTPSQHNKPSTEPSPDAVATSEETIQRVHQALKELPDDLREALTLSVFEDMSYAEIAHIAKCSPKAIETRIYRARLRLKALLAGVETN